jgi:hypothetical protein
MALCFSSVEPKNIAGKKMFLKPHESGNANIQEEK